MECGTATKKPVLIDWFLWQGDDFYLEEWVKSFNQKYLNHFVSTTNTETNKLNLFVKTLEGTSYDVPENYVIIRGVEGEYYPCEPKIFEKTYNVMILNKK
jgi:hypothetical protein